MIDFLIRLGLVGIGLWVAWMIFMFAFVIIVGVISWLHETFKS